MKDISIWLIPREGQREILQETINSMAKKYHAYTFIPHVTAYHLGTGDSLKDVISVIKNVSTKTKPITLKLKGIFYSEQFTKSLYAQYEISPNLQNLYNDFKSNFYSLAPYELNPHLSLIYKNNMNNEDKLKEINKLKLKPNLILDRIMVITKNGGSIITEKDILDWKISFDARLLN